MRLIPNNERRPVRRGGDVYSTAYAHGWELGYWRGFPLGALLALAGSLAWAWLS